jgi:hypothetical protein
MSQGSLTKKYFNRFVRNEVLRREYLNQTFQVLPEIADVYFKIVHDEDFEIAQHDILTSQGNEFTGKIENHEKVVDVGNKMYYLKRITIMFSS